MSGSLSRRDALRHFGAVTAAVSLPVLGSKAVASAAPGAPTFFVSASGDDNADGLSPLTSWATIQRANSALPNDGSVLLFRRGDTFYGELDLPFGCEVGAFGVGDKPILTLFKTLNRPEGWVAETTGLWKIDLSSPDTHDGYTATSDANIGYLTVDGAVKPALKFDPADLSEPWDFYCDIPNNLLYIVAPANPTTLATDIKAAPNGNNYGPTGRVVYCSKGSNDIHDIHVTGSGGCGIGGTGPDVHIHDCLIDYIGGSYLEPRAGVRYGNAIENWVNVKLWLIEDNEIAHAYDAAFSPQGVAGTSGGWEDLTLRNNHIHNCTQSIEFASWGATESAPGYQRILVEGNLIEQGGYSVFSDVRPDQDVRVFLNSYLWETPAEITIQNNVFNDVYGTYSFHAREPVGLVTRNNTIRMRAGQRMQFQRPETVEDFAAWQEATGREVGSTMTIFE